MHLVGYGGMRWLQYTLVLSLSLSLSPYYSGAPLLLGIGLKYTDVMFYLKGGGCFCVVAMEPVY